jgi:hypothetical protein
MSLKLITKILNICTKPYMNLGKGINLKLILSRMKMVICLDRWKNFFNHMLNVHGVHDVRQMDIHMAESLVPEPGLVKVEIAIAKLKR